MIRVAHGSQIFSSQVWQVTMLMLVRFTWWSTRQQIKSSTCTLQGRSNLLVLTQTKSWYWSKRAQLFSYMKVFTTVIGLQLPMAPFLMSKISFLSVRRKAWPSQTAQVCQRANISELFQQLIKIRPVSTIQHFHTKMWQKLPNQLLQSEILIQWMKIILTQRQNCGNIPTIATLIWALSWKETARAAPKLQSLRYRTPSSTPLSGFVPLSQGGDMPSSQSRYHLLVTQSVTTRKTFGLPCLSLWPKTRQTIGSRLPLILPNRYLE